MENFKPFIGLFFVFLWFWCGTTVLEFPLFVIVNVMFVMLAWLRNSAKTENEVTENIMKDDTSSRILSRTKIDSTYYLYLIEQSGTGYVKIGISNNVQKRLKSLQTGSPQTLNLLHSIGFPNKNTAQHIEQVLHKQYQDQQVSGEWFTLDSRPVIVALEAGKALATGSNVKSLNTQQQDNDFSLKLVSQPANKTTPSTSEGSHRWTGNTSEVIGPLELEKGIYILEYFAQNKGQDYSTFEISIDNLDLDSEEYLSGVCEIRDDGATKGRETKQLNGGKYVISVKVDSIKSWSLSFTAL